MEGISREVERIIEATSTVDGAAARIRRSIGSPKLRQLDPFLLLDEFFVEPPASFPMHPHRGFEIVTYVIKGAFEHEDSAGGKGRIEANGVQHIVAGKGIEHSEFPGTKGVNYGLQLWVSLPTELRDMEPSWQDYKPEDLPVKTTDGGAEVRSIVGGSSPLQTHLPTSYVHVKMPKDGRFEKALDPDFTAFVYPLTGSVRVGTEAQDVHASQLAILRRGSFITVQSSEPSEFVIAASKPLGQTIRRKGGLVL